MARGKQGAHGRYCPQMVGGHEFHCARAQQAYALQLPLVAHELQEARVVHRRRHQAAAARLHAGGLTRIDHLHGNAAVRIVRKGFGNAVLLRQGHLKAGFQHAQRLQDGLPQVLAQWLATDHFDQAPQHVGGAAVFPDAAGRVHQRHAG